MSDAPSGRGDTQASYPGGAFETHTREPGLMPSFFHNGVREYPLTSPLPDASSTLHLNNIERGLQTRAGARPVRGRPLLPIGGCRPRNQNTRGGGRERITLLRATPLSPHRLL